MSNPNPSRDITAGERRHDWALEVLRIFLKLDLTCAGGPIEPGARRSTRSLKFSRDAVFADAEALWQAVKRKRR